MNLLAAAAASPGRRLTEPVLNGTLKDGTAVSVISVNHFFVGESIPLPGDYTYTGPQIDGFLQASTPNDRWAGTLSYSVFEAHEPMTYAATLFVQMAEAQNKRNGMGTLLVIAMRQFAAKWRLKINMGNLTDEGKALAGAFIRERAYWGKQAAGVFVVARSSSRFLSVRRGATVNEPLTWAITVSGRVESNETVIAAARREFQEETGQRGIIILPSPLDIFRDKDFTFTTFFGLVESEFTPISNWEISGHRWCAKASEIPQPRHFGTALVLAQVDAWVARAKTALT